MKKRRIAIRPLPCWCGADEWSQSCVSHRKRFAVLQCPECGTYRIDPPQLSAANELEGFYTQYYEAVGSETCIAASRNGRGGPFWQIAERFPELQVPSGPIAEIGAGDGHRCAELKDAGWPRVIGFEISKARAARAQTLYPDVEIYSCTLQQSDLRAASLHAVLMEAVIEHLPNPLEQIREIGHFLKQGGYLVLTTPNMDSGHFRLLSWRWTPSLAPHAHIFLFGKISISALLARAGLQPVIVGSFHTKPYGPVAYLKRAFSGDVKGAVWRAVQETGGFYGRLIGEGPLLYAVGRKA